jgi:hypothetical protein
MNDSQLSRLIGTSDAPRIVDVRIDDDHSPDPRMLPGSVRLSHLSRHTSTIAFETSSVDATRCLREASGAAFALRL